MKRIIYIFSLASILFSVGGCSEDLLEKKPLDQFSDADFWKNENLAVTAINQLYVYLSPDDGFHDFEALTHNSVNGVLWGFSHARGQAGWTATDANWDRQWNADMLHGLNEDASSSIWKVTYREIRDCNVAITNLEANETKTERLEQLIGEAKFMRAYLYHILTRKYGGIPLVDKPLGLNDDLNLPRNTYNECVDFMIKDLDDALRVLPSSWDGKDKGRITEGAVLALKGRIELYAERWEDAVETYGKLLDDKYTLFPDYKSLFHLANENNNEVILDVQFLYPEFVFAGNAQAASPTQGGWGAGGPSQDLIDQFDLRDGKAWNDATSVYYDPNDPYSGRDLRFYGIVQHDQGVYFGKRLETGSGTDGKGNLIKGADVEKNNDVTQTGYYLAKYLEVDAPENTDVWIPAETNQIILRYAEVLLSYAEAKNEALASPDQTVYDRVNEVRARAGLPGLPAGLTKDQMRDRIKKERRIEFAFEYTYYYDCLRWRDKNRFTGNPRIVNIEYEFVLNPDGTVKLDDTSRKIIQSRTFTYSDYYESRVFNLDTDYGWFFPIPQEEIDKNPNLIQNGQFQGNNKQ